MEEDKQPRQVNRALATFVTVVVGIIGGIAGIAMTLFAMIAIPTVIGLDPFTSAMYFVAPGLAISLGPLCAMFGGWATGRLIDRFEGDSIFPRYRDTRSGGIITLVAKAIVWTVFILFVGVTIILQGN